MKKIGQDVIEYDNKTGRIKKIGSDVVHYEFSEEKNHIVKVGNKTVYYEGDNRFHSIGDEKAIYNQDGTIKSFGTREVEYEILSLSARPVKTSILRFPFWADLVMKPVIEKSDLKSGNAKGSTTPTMRKS